MPLKGNLSTFRLVQLLNLINLAKRTGTLHIYEAVETGRTTLGVRGDEVAEVVAGAELATFTLKEGMAVFATVTEKPYNLADILRDGGYLSEAQVQIIRERGNSHSDKSLALLLINANYISKQNIVDAIKQYIEFCFSYVADRESNQPFMFVDDATVPADSITITVGLESIIIQLTRRSENAEQLKEQIPDLDMVLKFPDAPTEKYRNVNLSVAEWRVVSYINPKNSIRDIAVKCDMTEFEIRRAVYGLLEAGLVQIVRPAGRPASPSPLAGYREPSSYKLAHHERILWNHFREALCVYNTTENNVEKWYILAVWQDQQEKFREVTDTTEAVSAALLGHVLKSGEGGTPPNDAFDRALAEQNPIEVDAQIYKYFKGWLKEQLQYSGSKKRVPNNSVVANLLKRLREI